METPKNEYSIYMSNYSLRSSVVVDRQPLSPFRGTIFQSIPVETQQSSTSSENNYNNEDEDMDSFLPGIFSGTDDENPKDWIRNFELFCTLKGLQPEARKAAFSLSLRDIAGRWLLLLDDDTKNDRQKLHEAFVSRFSTSLVAPEEKMRRFWTAKQETKESVRNFVDRMRSNAVEIDVKDLVLTTAIQSELRPSIRQHVARQGPKSVDELLQHALLAESTEYSTGSSLDDITTAIRRLEDKFDKLRLQLLNPNPNNPHRTMELHINHTEVLPDIGNHHHQFVTLTHHHQQHNRTFIGKNHIKIGMRVMTLILIHVTVV